MPRRLIHLEPVEKPRIPGARGRYPQPHIDADNFLLNQSTAIQHNYSYVELSGAFFLQNRDGVGGAPKPRRAPWGARPDGGGGFGPKRTFAAKVPIIFRL